METKRMGAREEPTKVNAANDADFDGVALAA